MSDDLQKRIADLERDYAVQKVQIQGVIEDMDRSRKDFNAQLKAMHGDFKQSMVEQSAQNHRRTSLLITVTISVVTLLVNGGIALLVR